MSNEPSGSGHFARICGFVFLLIFIASWFVSPKNIPPEWIMRGWFFFVAITLVLWGHNRVKTGRQDNTIGQSTINLVIGILGATFALLALLNDPGK